MKTLVKSIAKKITEYKRYRRTVTELSNLTNRDLADIGLSRADIHRVASHYITR
jgi:uncharacterized protein YjiS (DUF1127 family)